MLGLSFSTTSLFHLPSFRLVPSGSPESVVVEPFSSKSLRIMWDPPPKSEQNGLIVNYKISWEPAAGDSDDGGEPGERIVPASNERQRSFVVDGLIPYTEYKVTVAAGTEKGFGPPSKSVTARTLDDGMCVLPFVRGLGWFGRLMPPVSLASSVWRC